MINSRFKEKLNNTPHLMTEQTFLNVVDILESSYTKEMLSSIGTKATTSLDNYNPDTKIGTISVEGALTYKSEWYQEFFGGNSYENILDQVSTLANAGMKTLLMIHDSGGGEAYGVFETGDKLRALADNFGFNIISYVDGMCASADYALASASDVIIANPQSEVGSIGVVVRLRNINEAMQNAGVKDTYVFAGENKIPYKADGSWSEAFINDTQQKVDAVYEEFTGYVAEKRNMSVEAVKATKAATYLAKDAVDVGLIDSVMTHDEFYTYLADYVQKEKNPQMIKLFKLNSEQETVKMKELEEMSLELSAIKAKMEDEIAVKAALESEIVSLKATLQDAQTKLSQFEELSAKLEQQKQDEMKAKAEALLEERKKLLAEVLPQDQVDAALTLLGNADQNLFDFAYAGYKAKQEAVLKTQHFQEIGNVGETVDHGKPNQVAAFIEWQKKEYKTK